MNVALFGGSFDPIHTGHIELLRTFIRHLSLDKVIVMPTFVPPHKIRTAMAPPDDRLAMCRLAVENIPQAEVSDFEIRRGGASFTVDTLSWLKEQYPDASLFLLMGADMFLTLGTWYRFDRIAALATLCTVPRDDIDETVLTSYAETLSRHGACCKVVNIPIREISSTILRERLRCGQTTAEDVPPSVERYIAEKGLYRETAHTKTADEQFIEIIRQRLTPNRFEHSLAVAAEAKRLAVKYGADPAKAYTAGLLHDIMKTTDNETQLQMMREFGILLDEVEEKSPKLWHARSGEGFVRHILGLKDEGILSAIRYHTTARAGMSPLEKTLYLADYTSADRDYEDVDVMRRLVDESAEQALLYALNYTIEELQNRGASVHPDTLAAYDDTVRKIKEAENGGKG